MQRRTIFVVPSAYPLFNRILLINFLINVRNASKGRKTRSITGGSYAASLPLETRILSVQGVQVPIRS